MKRLITLHFPSFEALWNFKITTHPSFFELSPGKCLLSCACSETDIELAVKTYGAQLVDPGSGVLKEAGAGE